MRQTCFLFYIFFYLCRVCLLKTFFLSAIIKEKLLEYMSNANVAEIKSREIVKSMMQDTSEARTFGSN